MKYFLLFISAIALMQACGSSDECVLPECASTVTTTTSTGGQGGQGGQGGASLLGLGEACDDSAACESNACSDGVCCASACDGACEACDSAGTCAPHAEGTDPDAECAGDGLVTCNGSGACFAPAEVWARGFGSTGTEWVQGMAVNAGNVYVAGRFSSPTLTIGGTTLTHAGNSDVFVASLSGDGTPLWAKSFGSSSADLASAVAVGDGAVFVAGEYAGSPTYGQVTLPSSSDRGWFVMRLDEITGNVEWVKTGAQPMPAETEVTALVYRSTGLYGLIRVGGNVFLAHFNLQTGATQSWPLGSFTATSEIYAWGLSECDDGDFLVTGIFTGTTAIAGGPAMTSAGGADAFVARVTPGTPTTPTTHVFSTPIGGPAEDGLYDVIELPNGDIAAAGYAQSELTFGASSIDNAGGYDAILLRLTSAGEPIDGAAFGGPGADELVTLELAPNGDFLVAGSSTGDFPIGGTTFTGAGEYDIFLARVSQTFVPLWALHAGGPAEEFPWTMAADQNAVYLGGSFASPFGFTTELTPAGFRDAFVLELKP